MLWEPIGVDIDILWRDQVAMRTEDMMRGEIGCKNYGVGFI